MQGCVGKYLGEGGYGYGRRDAAEEMPGVEDLGGDGGVGGVEGGDHSGGAVDAEDGVDVGGY